MFRFEISAKMKSCQKMQICFKMFSSVVCTALPVCVHSRDFFHFNIFSVTFLHLFTQFICARSLVCFFFLLDCPMKELSLSFSRASIGFVWSVDSVLFSIHHSLFDLPSAGAFRRSVNHDVIGSLLGTAATHGLFVKPIVEYMFQMRQQMFRCSRPCKCCEVCPSSGVHHTISHSFVAVPLDTGNK